MDKTTKNKKDLELVTSCFLGYKTKFRKILLLMYYQTKFHNVIENGVIPYKTGTKKISL